MGRYHVYPEYKCSEVDWFDSVPVHWEVKRISYFAQLKSGDAIVSEQIEAEGQYPVYGGNGLRGYTSNYTHEGHYILIGRQGALCGNINYGEGKFWASEHAIVVHPFLPTHTKWLGETLRAMNLNQYNVSAAQPGLAVANITCLKVPFPSYAEQQAIANFLDHETAKIDTLIEKQQQLIQLLKEKRQAVISHAVTKGLNPNAPMKDSGVEWLGQVPEHWKVTKFNYEIDLLEGPGILAVDFHEEGVPLLRIQNVKEEFVTNDFKTYLSPAKVKTKWEHFRVSLGDLIISCSASTGLVSEVAQDTVGSIPYTGLIRLRPKSKLISKDFIRILVQSDLFFEQINLLQAGSTIQHFGPYHLQQMYITLPPIREQLEIFQFVKKNLDLLDAVVQATNQQIELMMERRTALISAAVTGKIDVRN
jgi:type I restriction enzyme S subunit